MCCWDTWNLADVPPGVELIVLKEEDYNFGRARNNCNLYKQALTTFHGLRHVRTDFALKVRTDEYYTDLTFILDSLNKDPSKVVIGNTMFGRNHWDFSDHLYAGKTYMLLQTLATVLDYCEERDFNFHIHHPNCNETVLLSAMLKALDKVNLDYPTAIKENFVLAPSQKLGDFYAVSNVCKVEFTPANIEDGYLTIQSFDHL